MEITNNKKTASLDSYLEKLKERIPSLATTRSSTKQKIDLRYQATIFKMLLDEQCQTKNYVIDLDKREKLSSIFAWVWKYDQWNKCGLDYNKGLFLFGPVGTGKSTVMKGLQKYMNYVKSRDILDDYRIGFFWKSASELANSYAGNGQEKLLQWCDECNLLIDELGREPRPAKHYGTELNVIQFLLQLRYDRRKGNITHITSNVSPQDIMPLYGDYISDRFREMFNIIHWGGSSKR
jgi:DNA replication protein DnaC